MVFWLNYLLLLFFRINFGNSWNRFFMVEMIEFGVIAEGENLLSIVGIRVFAFCRFTVLIYAFCWKKGSHGFDSTLLKYVAPIHNRQTLFCQTFVFEKLA